MNSAGPSRPRVITLTADQLLGTSLTPARSHIKQNKNTPRVLTIEDLLGSGLTVARQASPKPSSRPPSRSAARTSASTRSAPNPRLAVKARSGQAQVLSAQELLSSGTSRASSRRPNTAGESRGRTEQSNAPGRPGADLDGPTTINTSAGQSTGGSSADSSRGTRPPTTGQRSGRGETPGSGSQGRSPRPGQARRSMSLGSTRTLPMYTQEPGESEVVVDRGATELEDDDDVPITVMSPVDENEPNADSSASADATADSPRHAENVPLSRQLSPADADMSIASSLPSHLPPWTALYSEAAPSYEAAMSTPNLHAFSQSPVNVPLPNSPPLRPVSPAHIPLSSSPSSPPASPALRPTARVQISPTPPASATVRSSPNARSPVGTPSPSSPAGDRADGTETSRRRFGFMSIFHSRSSSRLRSRSHSQSHAAASVTRVASPDLLAPRTRAFHPGAGLRESTFRYIEVTRLQDNARSEVNNGVRDFVPTVIVPTSRPLPPVPTLLELPALSQTNVQRCVDELDRSDKSDSAAYAPVAELLSHISQPVSNSFNPEEKARLHLGDYPLVFLDHHSCPLTHFPDHRGCSDGTDIPAIVGVRDIPQGSSATTTGPCAGSCLYRLQQAGPDRPGTYGLRVHATGFQILYASSLGVKAAEPAPWSDLDGPCAYVYSLYDPPCGLILHDRTVVWHEKALFGAPRWTVTAGGRQYPNARIIRVGYPWGSSTTVLLVLRHGHSLVIIKD
ncbi:hypothetical protein BD413DRAFT_492334 [Trametes elegans]|nr:hypothetical protein BD413DRAFT_492334 [Trametes elegans]